MYPYPESTNPTEHNLELLCCVRQHVVVVVVVVVTIISSPQYNAVRVCTTDSVFVRQTPITLMEWKKYFLSKAAGDQCVCSSHKPFWDTRDGDQNNY